MAEAQRSNLLVVDDDAAVLEGVQRSLRHEPYLISCAQSAAAALQLMEQTSFAAVITDEQMPGMSGSQLLTTVRRLYPHTARILLTGQATLSVAVRCINDADVARFLEKPCTAEALRQALVEVIGVRPASTTGAFSPDAMESLSPREREVFELMGSGLRLSQIAKRLFVSPHTIRNHVKAIFQKLDVHSQTELLERVGR